MAIPYDALVVITPKDFLRLSRHYLRLVKNLDANRIIFVGSGLISEYLVDSQYGEKVSFLDENDIIPFDQVHAYMKQHLKDILNGEDLPRGVTGWYYQQFLKMQYARMCSDNYYMVWDGDTIPCRKIEMFEDEDGLPYLDLKKEYHKEYFETLQILFSGMSKTTEQSYISEHMMFRTDIMKQMLRELEQNESLEGDTFWKKIIKAIPPYKIQETAFSEFETYGTYCSERFPDAYHLRRWHSFRLGAEFFDPQTIEEKDFEWLGRDFYAISFEKNQSVREDHKGLFSNSYYQSKLTAKQMLMIAQEEFGEGYIEEWDEKDPVLERLKEKEDPVNWNIEVESPLKYLTTKTWKDYELLGDRLSDKNANQAYLCFENALFLCPDEEQKKRLTDNIDKFNHIHEISVRKTAIVILSYNCKYMMKKCVESIYTNCNPQTYQMVILDNASSDGIAEWLKKLPAENLTLLLSDENMGFPAGCNAAVSYAPKDYDLFFLNNDTRMPPNALFWLRMALYDSESVGATGAIQNYYDPQGKTDQRINTPEEFVKYGAEKNVFLDDPIEEVPVLNGFAMLIKRNVYDKTQGFDENFTPGYFEDDDLSLQICKAGYRLFLCNNSFIYHAGSQSFTKRSYTELNDLQKRNLDYLENKWNCKRADYMKKISG